MRNNIFIISFSLIVMVFTANFHSPALSQQYDADAVKLRKDKDRFFPSLHGSMVNVVLTIQEFISDGNYNVALEAIRQQERTNLKEYHIYLMNDMRALIYARQSDLTNAIRLYRTNLDADRLPAKLEDETMLNLVGVLLQNQNYNLAMIYSNKWLIYNEVAPIKIHAALARSYAHFGELSLAREQLEKYNQLLESERAVFDQNSYDELERLIYSQTNIAKEPTKKIWLLDDTKPRYPRFAGRRKAEGEVKVIFDVTGNGKPTNIRITESANEYLNEFAIEAARDLKFILYSKSQEDIYRRDIPHSFHFEANK